jgi:hypothetical protein
MVGRQVGRMVELITGEEVVSITFSYSVVRELFIFIVPILLRQRLICRALSHQLLRQFS